MVVLGDPQRADSDMFDMGRRTTSEAVHTATNSRARPVSGRLSRWEDDAFGLKMALRSTQDAAAHLLEAFQEWTLNPTGSRTKLATSLSQAALAKRLLDEFLAAHRYGGGDNPTMERRDLVANRERGRERYHERRRKKLCVKCGRRAKRGLARCSKCQREMEASRAVIGRSDVKDPR